MIVCAVPVGFVALDSAVALVRPFHAHMSLLDLSTLLTLVGSSTLPVVGQGSVEHDAAAHTVTMSDARRDLRIHLKYGGCCYLDSAQVRGLDVVAAATGVRSGISVGGKWTTTRSGFVIFPRTPPMALSQASKARYIP